jgi:poly(3-hydroxybutyrate) depolymerase
MLYQAYQVQADAFSAIRAVADFLQDSLQGATPRMAPLPPRSNPLQILSAACEMVAAVGLSHLRPDFGISTVRVGNRDVVVREKTVAKTAFGKLLHFEKEVGTQQPRVLVVAPLSGHFATLLRNCVRTLLSEHDVYITDWHNARDIDLSHGEFEFDDYVDHIIKFIATIGSAVHVVAVCQPCVQVLAAAALMAEEDHPALPASMTLMAGPIDARISPTKVNELATSKPIEWFANNLIATVPYRFEGRGRQVYPGFLQLTAFMSMNLSRHVKSHVEWFEDLAAGRRSKAQAKKDFYEEYFAVLDLSAAFYLQTVRLVFQEYQLAKGMLKWRGRKVDPRAIRRTALFTVEGEMDDICAMGQTLAAQDLCINIKPHKRRHHLQAGSGHFGVFNGRRWETQIYPILRNVILASER